MMFSHQFHTRFLRGGRVARRGEQVVSYAPMASIIAVALGLGAPDAAWSQGAPLNIAPDLQVDLSIPAGPPLDLSQTIVGAGDISARVAYLFGGDYSTAGPVSPDVRFEQGFSGTITLQDLRPAVISTAGGDPRFVILRTGAGGAPNNALFAPDSVHAIVGSNISFSDRFDGTISISGNNGVIGIQAISAYTDLGPLVNQSITYPVGFRTEYGRVDFERGFFGEINVEGVGKTRFFIDPFNNLRAESSEPISAIRGGAITFGSPDFVGVSYDGTITLATDARKAVAINSEFRSVDVYRLLSPTVSQTVGSEESGQIQVYGSMGGIFDLRVSNGAGITGIDSGDLFNVTGDFNSVFLVSGDDSGGALAFLADSAEFASTRSNFVVNGSVNTEMTAVDVDSAEGFVFGGGTIGGDFAGTINFISADYANAFAVGNVIIGGDFSTNVNLQSESADGYFGGFLNIGGSFDANFLVEGEADRFADAAGFFNDDVTIGEHFSGSVEVSTTANGFVKAIGILMGGDFTVGGDFSGTIMSSTFSGSTNLGESLAFLIDGKNSATAFRDFVPGGSFVVGGDLSGRIIASAESGSATALRLVGSDGNDGDARYSDVFSVGGVISGEISATSLSLGGSSGDLFVSGLVLENLDRIDPIRLTGTIAAQFDVADFRSLDESGALEVATAINMGSNDFELTIASGGHVIARGEEAYGIRSEGAAQVSVRIEGSDGDLGPGRITTQTAPGYAYAPAIRLSDIRNPAPDIGASIEIDNAGVLSGAYTLDFSVADQNNVGVFNNISITNSGSILSDDNEADGLDFNADAIGIYGGFFDGTSVVETPTRVSLTNSGTISAAFDAVYLGTQLGGSGSEFRISNLAGGIIRGDSDGDGEGRAITDRADFEADQFGFDTASTVLNAGSIVGGVSLGGGSDRFELIDGGTLDGSLSLGSGLDVFAVRATAGVSDAGFVMPGSGGEVDLGLMGIEIVEKLGAGAYTLGVSDGAGLLMNALDVREGRLVLSSATWVSEEASADAASLLGADNGGVVVSDAVSGIETALEVQRGFQAGSLSLGAGSGIFNFATGAMSRVVLIDGDGAAVPDATITGGEGTQRIFNRSVLNEDGQVLYEARIVNAISLGAGDDRVTSNYGVFEGLIDLGAGNDIFEIFMTPDGDESTPGTLFGGSFVSVDGGDGEDTLMLSLRSGQRVLTANPLQNEDFQEKLQSVERLAKGGAGTIVFAFETSGAGSTEQVLIEGPAVFEQTAETGTFILSQIDDPDAVAGGIVTTATIRGDGANSATVSVAGDVQMDGTGELVVENSGTLDAGGVVSEVGRIGSQRVDVQGSGRLIASGVYLGGGDDLVQIASGADVSGAGAFDGGGGSDDVLTLVRALGGEIGSGARSEAAGSVRTADNAGSDDASGSGFEVIELSAGTGEGTRLNVKGLLATSLGGTVTLGLGELNLNDADETDAAGDWATLLANGDRISAGTTLIGTASDPLDGGAGFLSALTGNGLILGDLEIGSDGLLRPGNSIGTIQVSGNFTLNGRMEVEYRVPDLADFVRSGGAFVGRNVYDGTATGVSDQDADLIIAGGTITIGSNAAFVVSEYTLGSTSSLLAAFADPANTAREVRYTIAVAEGGIPQAFTTVGNLDGEAGTNERVERIGDRLVLVFSEASGGGGGGGTTPPTGGILTAPDAALSFSLRRESVNAGCLPGKVLLFTEDDVSDGTCVWFDVSGATGSADLDGGLTEDLSEWQVDVGGEMRFGSASDVSETRVGVFAGYRDTALDYDTGASSAIETTRLGAYVDLRQGRTDLAFSLIWADHEVETTRFGLLASDRISGSYGAQSLSFNAEVTRWQYIDPCWDLGWVGGLAYATGSRDGYTETGSALEAFSFAEQDGNALWATLGVRARYRSHGPDGSAQSGGTLMPTDINLFAGIDTLVAGDPAFGVAGVYVGDPNAEGLSSGGSSRWEEMALRLEADMAMKLDARTTLSAGLGGRFADGSQGYAARLNLRMEW